MDPSSHVADPAVPAFGSCFAASEGRSSETGRRNPWAAPFVAAFVEAFAGSIVVVEAFVGVQGGMKKSHLKTFRLNQLQRYVPTLYKKRKSIKKRMS
jgi:hypothetical protein